MRPRSDTARKNRTHPLSLAEFARRAGRGRSTITELCQGPLAAAKLGDGRIDAGHPRVTAWAAARGIDAAALLRPAPRRAFEPAKRVAAPPVGSPPVVQSAPKSDNRFDPPDAEALLALTFGEIAERWGSVTGMADWLLSRRRVADVRRIELANAANSRRMISRELVRTHVFAHMDATNRRLLQDGAPTIARRIYAAAKGGASLEEAEATAREIISSHLRRLNEHTARVLREREPDHAPEGAKDVG